MTKLGPIAQQIEDRIAILCDPKTVHVHHYPRRPHQSCAVVDDDGERARIFFSRDALIWLNDFTGRAAAADRREVGRYRPNLTAFNDYHAKSTEEVVWLLQDALEEAIEEGV